MFMYMFPSVPMPGRVKAFVCSCICFLVYQCQGEGFCMCVYMFVSFMSINFSQSSD